MPLTSMGHLRTGVGGWNTPLHTDDRGPRGAPVRRHSTAVLDPDSTPARSLATLSRTAKNVTTMLYPDRSPITWTLCAVMCAAILAACGQPADPAADDDDNLPDAANSDTGDVGTTEDASDVSVDIDVATDAVDDGTTDSELDAADVSDVDDADASDAADSTDTADTADSADVSVDPDVGTGTWDVDDPRVTYAGRCDAEESFACDGQTLVECHCVRDADLNCLYREAYRTDCTAIFPEAGICETYDRGRGRCAVEPGGQCLFDIDELGLPPQNELWGLIELEPEASGVVAACAGSDFECVVESDGVGRCREVARECSQEPPEANDEPGITECTGTDESLQVLECLDPAGPGDPGSMPLSRQCTPETCGTPECSGLPDGSPCRLASTRGNGLTAWGLYRDVPCGPFSECDATTWMCEPRVCDPEGSGACSNAGDCEALSSGLETAYNTTLDCLEDAGVDGLIACVEDRLSVSTPCAACFGDLEGDFEACAGF